MPYQDLSTTISSGPQAAFLSRAYTLQTPSEASALYTEWSTSYDQDLKTGHYASPSRAVKAYLKHLSPNAPQTLEILDAGCGTGLQAEILVAEDKARTYEIDGIDLTQGMLDVARGKAFYRNLWLTDLNDRIDSSDARYDAVICVGTLTKGHVGPKVFAEFARVVKAGGLVVATVHDEIWESGGYKAEIEGLGANKVVEVVSTANFGMIQSSSEGGRMVVLRKC